MSFPIECRLRAVSLFSLVSHARERASSGEAVRREKRGRQPSRLAPSVTHVCILARFVRRTKKKQRLLVVYIECDATNSARLPVLFY